MTKRDRIVAELRRRIQTGELSRGARIQQVAIAQDFDTSITPVREALRQLEAEGLLVGEPNRGVRVADADLERVKGVYMLRRLVEPFAMRRAALRVSRRDIAEAGALNDGIERAHRENDGLSVAALNREFHFLFYEKAGPETFVAEIRNLWLGFPWDILQVLDERITRSVADHRAIVSAFDEGDLDAVGRATEDHIAGGYQALHRHMTSQPASPYADPFLEEND